MYVSMRTYTQTQTHTDTHTDTHRHTQTHTDTYASVTTQTNNKKLTVNTFPSDEGRA